MRCLDKTVSIFKNYMDANPLKSIKLRTFLTSAKYKDKVERIRSIQNKKERNRLKAQLPAVTPSGLFKTKRAAANLVEHSGLIQLDIDGKDNEHLDMQEVKEILMELPIVAYCGFSVSGAGVFALVPIAQPNRHREHFLALEEDLKNDHNILIDSSCKDVTRLRGYSYDKDYYMNENALVYEGLVEFKSCSATYPKKVQIEPINETDNFYSALKIISDYCLDITGSNEQWFTILCAIANEYGENGRSSAHLVSQYSELYDSGRCDTDYNRALSTNYSFGIGTFYYYFKQYVVMKPP